MTFIQNLLDPQRVVTVQVGGMRYGKTVSLTGTRWLDACRVERLERPFPMTLPICMQPTIFDDILSKVPEKRSMRTARDLSDALMCRNFALARKILDDGLNPNIRNQAGATALCALAFMASGHLTHREALEAVVMLREYGADLDSAQGKGQTALMHACDRGATELGLVLLLCGANPHLKTNCKRSALSFAAAQGNSTLVGELLKAGCDPNEVSENGATPLHFAVDAYCSKTMAVLLAAGANPDFVDGRGLTPLHRAAMMISTIAALEVIRALRGHADFNFMNKYAEFSFAYGTPLHRACSVGASLDIVKTLIECGADPFLEDQDGNNPLESCYAAGANRNHEVRDYLRSIHEKRSLESLLSSPAVAAPRRRL